MEESGSCSQIFSRILVKWETKCVFIKHHYKRKHFFFFIWAMSAPVSLQILLTIELPTSSRWAFWLRWTYLLVTNQIKSTSKHGLNTQQSFLPFITSNTCLQLNHWFLNGRSLITNAINRYASSSAGSGKLYYRRLLVFCLANTIFCNKHIKKNLV